MEAEHKGIASQAAVGTCGGQQQEPFWEDRKARVVGKMRCKVARRMAQWASLQDDEQQQGAGATNTPIWQTGLSSNDEVPHPLINCRQGKCSAYNDPATGWASDAVGGDVATGQDGGREGRADGEDDAPGNTIAIAGVNYLIAGAPPTPSTSWFDSSMSRYRHLTVQPHPWVVQLSW